MPRKPTLSPTKLSTYLACPLKYRWTFAHPQRALLRAKSYYSFGLTLHRVLEHFHANPDRGVDVAEQLQALYDESWLDAGYGSAEEMADAYAEGKEILERIEQGVTATTSARTIAVERSLRMDFGEFVLVGRIDRIDEHEDGTIEIIDYKSGRAIPTQEEVDADLALGCYQVLVRQLYPDRPLRATLLNLRLEEARTTTKGPEEMNEFIFALGELGRMILNHEWAEIHPVRKPLCEDCDFRRLCAQSPEF